MNNMVSIIMPAYNAALYLPRSIKSIQDQTYGDWELIVVDDGSTDQTQSVVARIGEKDQRVKLVCNRHGGTAKARNTAIEMVKGAYIAFIDADDAYHPCYLENLLNALNKNNADMAVCGIYVGTDYDEYLRAPLKEGEKCIDVDAAFSIMYDDGWPVMISPCNKLYKAELFNDVRFPDGRYFEDAATTNLAIFRCKNISILDAQMYFYHVTPGSSSKTLRSVELLDREWALRSHWEFFLENGRKDLVYLSMPFYLYELVIISAKIQRSDRPEDCSIIRERFVAAYRKYWRKAKTSAKRAEVIYNYRYPRLGTIRWMIRRDGVVKTISGLMKRRMGYKNER